MLAALCFLFVVLLVIGGTLFWIAMIIECATREPETGNNKIVWIIILVFTHFVGALIYYFVRRPERVREFGR
jgi:hypothetical protein